MFGKSLPFTTRASAKATSVGPLPSGYVPKVSAVAPLIEASIVHAGEPELTVVLMATRLPASTFTPIWALPPASALGSKPTSARNEVNRPGSANVTVAGRSEVAKPLDGTETPWAYGALPMCRAPCVAPAELSDSWSWSA